MKDEIYLTICKSLCKMNEDFKLNGHKIIFLNIELTIECSDKDQEIHLADYLVFKFYESRVLASNIESYISIYKQIVFKNIDLSFNDTKHCYDISSVSIKNTKITFAEAQLVLDILSIFQTVTIDDSIFIYGCKERHNFAKCGKSSIQKLILNSVDINVISKALRLFDYDDKNAERFKKFSPKISALFLLLESQIFSSDSLQEIHMMHCDGSFASDFYNLIHEVNEIHNNENNIKIYFENAETKIEITDLNISQISKINKPIRVKDIISNKLNIMQKFEQHLHKIDKESMRKIKLDTIYEFEEKAKISTEKSLKTNQELKIDLLYFEEELKDKYCFSYSDHNGFDAFGDIVGISYKQTSDQKNIKSAGHIIMITFILDSILIVIDLEQINIELFKRMLIMFKERHLNIYFTNLCVNLSTKFELLIEMIEELNTSLTHLSHLFITIGLTPGSFYSITSIKVDSEQTELLGYIINLCPCACELKCFDFSDVNSINLLLYGDNTKSLGFIYCRFNIDENFKMQDIEIKCKMMSFIWCDFYNTLYQPHQPFQFFASELIESKHSQSILDLICLNMDLNKIYGQTYMLDYLFVLGRKETINALIEIKLRNLSRFYSDKENSKYPYFIMSSLFYCGLSDSEISYADFSNFNKHIMK